ncbi:MarR family transcriptional regulator [Rathayibacter sp. VKM Ac-2805]|uniref:MarR family winged helix-turn-helix transcriptional regulator n=1 Tax=Rathayibacter sp. VKM Ac-2805 TaxID=2609258 RepID=UPI00131F5174|nr:MarR family transcriptional regulator [Rathayibacter sp. VKM Ac-2805]QHC72675.1 MarR family transcriptional regulator [Rathayibacter sp. VKM Ac-2805]
MIARLAVPLMGKDGAGLGTAMQAIVTWGTSTAFRERLMTSSGFPLPDDLPAFLLVNQLVYRGAARPTDLADAIQTGRSNVSKIVRRLEEAGLVVRGVDPGDERGVVVVLSDDGRAVGQRIVDTMTVEFGSALSEWQQGDLDLLQRLLVKLATSLDALPGHPLESAAGTAFPS